MDEVQKIVVEGKIFVVLPEEEYEDMLDIISASEIKAGGETPIPASVVGAIVNGENPVKAFRKLRGKTMAVLAKEVGISQPAIAGIESGHRTGHPATMKKIAEALDVSLDDLI